MRRSNDDAASTRTATTTELNAFKMFVNEKLADLSKPPPTSRDFIARLHGGGSGGETGARRPSVASAHSRRSQTSGHSEHSARSHHSHQSHQSAASERSGHSAHSTPSLPSRHGGGGKPKEPSVISRRSGHTRRSGVDRGMHRGSARVLEPVQEEDEDGIPMDASVNDAGVFSRHGKGDDPRASSVFSGAGVGGVSGGYKEPERRPFAFPSAGALDGLEENRNPETLQEKKELLKELDELQRQGVYKPKGARLTLKDPKEEILYEYDSAQTDANTSQAVDMVKGALKMGSGVLEGVTKMGNIQLLNGFHTTLTADMNKFNRPLTRLYKKHWRRGPISPEVELGVMVIGSLLWVMFCNWRGMDPKGSIFNGPPTTGSSDPFARPSIPAPFDVTPSPPGADTPAATVMPAPMAPPTVSAGAGPAPWQMPRPTTAVGTPAPLVVQPPAPAPAQQHQSQSQSDNDEESRAHTRLERLQTQVAKARYEMDELDKQARARLEQLRQMDIAMAQQRSDFQKEIDRAQQVAMMRAQAQVKVPANPVQIRAQPQTRPAPADEDGEERQVASKRKVVLAGQGQGQGPRKSTGLVVTRKGKTVDDDAVRRLVGDMSRLSVTDDGHSDEDCEDSVDSFSDEDDDVKSRTSQDSRTSQGSHGSQESQDHDQYAKLQALGIATAMPDTSKPDTDKGTYEDKEKSGRKTPAVTPGRRSIRKAAPIVFS